MQVSRLLNIQYLIDRKTPGKISQRRAFKVLSAAIETLLLARPHSQPFPRVTPLIPGLYKTAGEGSGVRAYKPPNFKKPRSRRGLRLTPKLCAVIIEASELRFRRTDGSATAAPSAVFYLRRRKLVSFCLSQKFGWREFGI